MSVIINSWEDGGNEGRFETVEEAEAYVLENDMDVVVCGNDGRSYRFNAEIFEKEQVEKIADRLKDEWSWTEEYYTKVAVSLFKAGVRFVEEG